MAELPSQHDGPRTRLTGKVVVLTGAAGGIGAAAALQFAREGATVAGLDLNEERGTEIFRNLAQAGYPARFDRCDVTDARAVRGMIERIASEYLRIDILCNVAGNLLGRTFDVLATSESDWDLLQSVNLKSVYLVSKEVLPHMLTTGSGSIVNISSAAGLLGYPNRAAYAAAKGGVVSLTRAMAMDYADRGVRVNCIAPGVVRTPALDHLAEVSGQSEVDRMLQGVPMRRAGRPEEIARAIVFLASDDASFITGTVLPVDGGYSAH